MCLAILNVRNESVGIHRAINRFSGENCLKISAVTKACGHRSFATAGNRKISPTHHSTNKVSLFHLRKEREFSIMSIVHKGHPPNDWDGWESHILHFHKFACLPSGKNKCVSSPQFSSFGSQWTLRIYPGGDDKAREGNISLYIGRRGATEDFSCQIHVLIKNNKSGGADIENNGHHKFTGDQGWGWPDFASRAEITHADFLKNGTLTVEVRIKSEEEDRWQHFIPKNPFVQLKMHIVFSEERADMFFKVESRLNDTPEDSLPSQSEVIRAHKLVLKICAKGSILASLCEDCDRSTQHVTITDIVPKVFRLMLRYVYGKDLSAADWKDHAKDLIEAADKYGLTNLKIEAEARYVKLLTFSPSDAVETVAYAEKMNCFLLKEAAIDFIVANANKVLASGTVKNLNGKDIPQDILFSIVKSKQGKKLKIDSDDLNQLSMDDLRAWLELRGTDFDGSKESLISRLKNHYRV
ncbi:hypothetical protein ACHAW5_004001 [Stephanodiscus triporus]|uniref:MATH domain-containing protein n=1 Tax=Stephanodiscus triporus TaxID=2934178 RepID=A0ABD3PHK9_9STRA